MDQVKYQLYCLSDRSYFDTPSRMAEARFAIAARAEPEGWVRREQELWIVLEPAGVRLPDQGWKIHVSATMHDSEEAIGVVWDFCVAHGLAFKFLRSPRAQLATSSKHAPRGASGKLLTIYPGDDDVLAKTLTGLAPRLSSLTGPYILGDLRFESGPLYVRYGAFGEMHCHDENGEPALGVRGPDGRIVPDVRGPVFAIPGWVTVPDVLRQSLQARAQSSGTLPYTVERPLHFTNGGGLYRALDPATGTAVVLREARPHAGLDDTGADALTRLRRDRDLRALLAGLRCVPKMLGYYQVWEHEFLAEEFVAGRTLLDHIIERYPFAQPAAEPEEITAYLDWLEGVTLRIGDALDQLHQRGVHHGDLHPGNVILAEDGRVVLVDLELASDVLGAVRPGLRTQGFAPPAHLSGMEADRYALDCIDLYGRMPLTQMIDREPAKVNTLIDAAQELLGPVERGRWSALTKQVPWGATDRAAAMFQAEPLDWPAIRSALVAGILASATPDRTDRLFPGDITQFSTGGIALRDGAAGVLFALHRAGSPIPADYLDWLVRAARSPQRGVRVGLFDGRHGVALLLEEVGRAEEAAEILTLARSQDHTTTAGLLAGRAGIAISLLHMGIRLGDLSIMDEAMRYGDELLAMLNGDPTDVRLPAAAGLMRGMSGVALALLRIYEYTDDVRYLDAAEVALHRDLGRCVSTPDGRLHVNSNNRYLVYLDGGSGGIAIAMQAYLRHRANPAFADAIDGVRRACLARFVFQPGLLNGRAGILAALNHLANAADRPAVLRHVRDLGLHAVTHDGGLAFPGAWMLRLSTDLGTGSAGVLLSLLAVFEADLPVLPFLEPETIRYPAHRKEGGEL